MMVKKWIVGGVISIGLLGGTMAGAALADQPADPGCNGQAVKVRNLGSGTNENNAKGPGYFFRDGQTVKAAIEFARQADGCL
jgi:hypothetical protein